GRPARRRGASTGDRPRSGSCRSPRRRAPRSRRPGCGRTAVGRSIRGSAPPDPPRPDEHHRGAPMNAQTPDAVRDAENVLEVTNLGVDFWVDGEFYPAAKDLNYVVKR